ncbi:hypothetical protein QBC38DRAFT_231089 [Podospora fimiseda]|uniref:Uncharacterized protein n=1 Tax=Podospora fimiseda TaxID=252190 RepID=A0AAN7BNA6_9PEZI|nr:hypothetical protein QBC38DRAFT_231089 [Podospora fimiseda]
MARELYSLFILALAAEIKEVRGKTTKTDTRKWANTFFDALAEEAVKARLAVDLDDALTLVIPAFARYNLLPKEYSSETEEEEDDTARSTGATGVGIQP